MAIYVGRTCSILDICLFLREHPHIEVPVFVGLKGGGNNEILSRGKTEAVAQLPQVDEGLGACC